MSQPLHTEFPSAKALTQAIQSRQVSPTELAHSALEALANTSAHNIFVHVDADRTLAEAKRVDTQLEQGGALGLAGLPLAYTDMLVTQGWRTTAASKMLASYTSPFDATVVERASQAGGVCLGKLNCDEFGMGADAETSFHGSLGGAVPAVPKADRAAAAAHAAVSKQLIWAAVASPVDGAPRCGLNAWRVSSLRPTYGVASRLGLIPSSSSMDQPSVIARQSIDVAMVLDTISGFDAADGTSLQHCGQEANAPGRIQTSMDHIRQQFNAHDSTPLKGLRIGVPIRFINSSGDQAIASNMEQFLVRLEALGAQRVIIDPPHLALATPTYQALNAAEVSSNLSRYDGVHFGFRAPHYEDLTDLITQSREQAFGHEVKQRILLGTYLLTEANYQKYYVQAQRVRRQITQSLRDALGSECDVLLAPDACFNDITAASMLAGLPALTLPDALTGPAESASAIQLIAPYFAEGLLLAIGEQYQQATETAAS